MFGRTIPAQLKTAIALSCGTLILSSQAKVPAAFASEAPLDEPQISLYSETATANAPDQGYIIVEQQGDMLIGAFYYPRSEYSCFTGHQTEQTLEILSLPSYQEPMSNFSISLQEMQQVPTLNTSHKQTLAACRQDVIAFLKQNQTAMDTHAIQEPRP